MRYELVHDSIARQILDRVSGESKARRQAELLVARAYKRYKDRGVLLSQDDLDEIRPSEGTINISLEEKAFIGASKKALERATRRKRQILLSIIALLSIFLLFAFWQWQRSLASTRALEAKAAYDSGWISRTFRMAQKAHSPFASSNTLETIEEVMRDVAASGLERDLVHHTTVKSFDINPSEEYILSLPEGPIAYVWDLQGNIQDQLEHPAKLEQGGFLPWDEGKKLMTLCEDQTAYFWDGEGNLIHQYALEGPIQGFAFNKKYQLTLLWGKNDLVLLSKTFEAWSFDSPYPDLIQASFSPNGNDLLLANQDSVSSWWLELIRIGRPQPRLTIPGKIQWADYIASDHIQLQILVQFADSSSLIFDKSGQVDTSSYYQFLNQQIDKTKIGPITNFVFSSPGHPHPKTLFQTDSTTLRYWSAYRKHLDLERAGDFEYYTRYDEPVLFTSFSPTDNYLLTAYQDGRVVIWDIQGSTIESYKRMRAQIRLATFAQSDRYLITTPGNKTIKIWRTQATPYRGLKQLFDFYDERIQSLQ